MATIANVAPDTPITSAWGNSVADELNLRAVKKSGGTMTGPLIIDAAPPLKLRRSNEAPGINFEAEATGNAEFAHILATTSGLYYYADQSGSRHQFYVLTAEVLTVGANLIRSSVPARFGWAGGNQVQILDIGGSGSTGQAYVGFYPSAINLDTPGSRFGYIGIAGEGFQVQADVGDLILQSVDAYVVLESAEATAIQVANPASALTVDVGTSERIRVNASGVLVGKTVADPDTQGVELLGPGAASNLRGTIRSTVTLINTANLYCRRSGTADADNQVFVDFTRATGTRIGSISQNGTTGVTYGTTSDYRLKNDLGPVTDATTKLQDLTPKHLAWKDGSGEFDGFLAHEVADVVPAAVSGAKDAVLPPDDPGNPGGIDPQQLDLGQLVPLLTAALQDTFSQVAALETRVAALEGAAP